MRNFRIKQYIFLMYINFKEKQKFYTRTHCRVPDKEWSFQDGEL